MSFLVSKKNLLLLFVLVIFLWIGWSDFEFIKRGESQEEIRESIRFYIRFSIQIAIQYVIPTCIIFHFLRDFFGKGKA